MNELVEMLTYRRPAGSDTEREFCERWIAPTGAIEDMCGNWMLRVGNAPVLWSSHTDTVHRLEGRQAVHVDRVFGQIRLGKKARKKGSNCLGADCTAGVWIMLGMIRAEVEGLYVFHYGEECGGIGSDYISQTTPEIVAGIEYAIAFDRRGYGSVVTHQGWYAGACCSAGFAQELADELGYPYAPDDGGIFTDTANYVHLISECTNLSVGYFAEHTQFERLDYEHLANLLAAMCEVDVTRIGARRIPQPSRWGIDDNLYGFETGGALAPEEIARVLKRCCTGLDDLSEDDVVAWIERDPDLARECLAELGF